VSGDPCGNPFALRWEAHVEPVHQGLQVGLVDRGGDNRAVGVGGVQDIAEVGLGGPQPQVFPLANVIVVPTASHPGASTL
jgi:hypothetical protein